MHVIFRESRGLEDNEAPCDLRQAPAELVVMSFSDSDLGAFAAGWQRGRTQLPRLRLANLMALRHPLSVDTYVENTLAGAKGILIRLIGGESYWEYGLSQIQDLARRQGIALAVLPADGHPDTRLDQLSTVPTSTLSRLKALCDAGGPVAAHAALAQLALAAGLYAPTVEGIKSLPEHGWYLPDKGVIRAAPLTTGDLPAVAVVFYRSYLAAADTGPVDALVQELGERRFAPVGIFAGSLKNPCSSAWIARQLARLDPAFIVNATAFSARGDDGNSPLDAPGCPVFQVALSTSRRREWQESSRGLSPSDLAMHVVLPEVDGRVFAGAASFKAPSARDPDLQYSRFVHRADADQVAAVCDRMAAWHALAATPPRQRRVALVLSTYPGRQYNLAHAVGLDPLASVRVICRELVRQGHDCGSGVPDPDKLVLTAEADNHVAWPVEQYLEHFNKLPDRLRNAVEDAWGPPADDPRVCGGAFRFRALVLGNIVIALQPERGNIQARADEYHDLDRVPRHGYVAFYMWLRALGSHAMIHVGAHGTLEWLPGKSVALSRECWPEVLCPSLPVIYPFIVNDPGEAAHAKRRLGAVAIGHMPPPLTSGSLAPEIHRLETLLDEYSVADGMDPARRDRLIGDIRTEARLRGLEEDLGIGGNVDASEAIPKIDRFVCDLKEACFGSGLHVFGTGECGKDELDGLTRALNGRHVPPGAAGSPFRGRPDVLPTGRNLYSADPRMVPSRSAASQGVRLAEELIRRYLQDNGDWPKNIVVNLWGSATMRTAGEEFAMALHLAGLAPRWADRSDRVNGFEILPPATLGRPRVDVTLRVSGLFRDMFPGLCQMFQSACDALAMRTEGTPENPFIRKGARVFGPKPGLYGLDMGSSLDDYSDGGRLSAGRAWLSASEWVIKRDGTAQRDRPSLEERVAAADGLAHVQDLKETDILLAADYASHQAGFAAARAAMGQAAPQLYHVDSSGEDSVRARPLNEELARVVRARASQPGWTAGMMQHGFRGAAEIAATLDHLAAFAHLARNVQMHLFDLYFDATLANEKVVSFMEDANPDALAAMRERFAALDRAGIWKSRRNMVRHQVGVMP